jgi:hypothetical protein
VRDRREQAPATAAGPVHRIVVTGKIAGGSVVIKPPREPKSRRRGGLRRLFSRSHG